LKKIILVVVLFIFIMSGCSSEKEKAPVNNEVNTLSSGEIVEIESVSNEEERERFQKIIEDFYYNPVITDETNRSFFEDIELITKFAGHYKAEYNLDTSLKQIAENFFGTEIKVLENSGAESYSGYDHSEKSKYLPVVEGIYQNDNLIIIKAGLYSLAEESNSEKKIFGTITATFEKNEELEKEYYLIDYMYEKIITEENK
jgi:hypothetical protein